MKKKSFKKLSLNKKAVSNLENIKGGVEPAVTENAGSCRSCPFWTCVVSYIVRGCKADTDQ